MDKQALVHPYNGILLRYERNWLLTHTKTWLISNNDAKWQKLEKEAIRKIRSYLYEVLEKAKLQGQEIAKCCQKLGVRKGIDKQHTWSPILFFFFPLAATTHDIWKLLGNTRSLTNYTTAGMPSPILNMKEMVSDLEPECGRSRN